ncbi:MAG: hypothetical protein OEN56_03110 [Gemmatimonadota bacterium]|nr:hypothetical protein [Gemmatimonadota bacterium]
MIISIVSLWLPIVLASVLVFIVSSLLHTVLNWHKNDYRRVPDENAALSALAPLEIPPGDYVLPYMSSKEDWQSEEFKAKLERGPVVFATFVDGRSVLSMGPQLTQWFAYTLLVGVVAAYVAGRTLGAGADYLEVFRLTGTVAFACYAMAMPQRSIWYHQNWPATLRSMADGFLYALLTAGAFGWLWPA